MQRLLAVIEPAQPHRFPLHRPAAVALRRRRARSKDDTLERIRTDLGDCTRCKLCDSATKLFSASGIPTRSWSSSAKARDTTKTAGLPFVGRAGQLLTQMIEAMGLKRDDVYIANVVKCRPPENRTPEKDEVATCMPFLLRQLAVIDPKVIVCLGSVATQALAGHQSIHLQLSRPVVRFPRRETDGHLSPRLSAA